MKLQRGSMFYKSLFSAKKDAILAAADFAVNVEARVKNIGDVNRREACEAAVLKFKKAIEEANKREKSSVALRGAVDLLAPVTNVIPLLDSAEYEKFFSVFSYYASCEFSQQDWDENWMIAREVFLAAALVGGFSLLVFAAGPAALPLLPATLFLLLMSIADTCDQSAQYDYHRSVDSNRDVIADQVVVSLDELDRRLYPAIIAASAPPMATAVYEGAYGTTGMKY